MPGRPSELLRLSCSYSSSYPDGFGESKSAVGGRRRASPHGRQGTPPTRSASEAFDLIPCDRRRTQQTCDVPCSAPLKFPFLPRAARAKPCAKWRDPWRTLNSLLGLIFPGLGRVGGGVAPAASHRSGRAQLRHPARQTTDSQRRSAIRCCFVDTGSGSDAPAMFPSNDSVVRRPLPSTGSRRLRFPGFHGTMERCDSLRTVRTGFLVVHPPLPLGCVCLRPSLPARRRPEGQGCCGRPHAAIPVESQGVSSSWGTLMRLCRVLRPRRDRAARLCGDPTRPPEWRNRRLPAGEAISGLHSTA